MPVLDTRSRSPAAAVAERARTPAPDLTPIARDAAAERYAGGALSATLGSLATPRFMIVDGDAPVDAAAVGVGMLYVAGRLRVSGWLAFTGVVAAADGVEIPAARRSRCAARSGPPASPRSMRAARGRSRQRRGDRLADRLAPLPARADDRGDRSCSHGRIDP